MAKIPSFSIIPKPKEEEPTWVAAIFWSLVALLVVLVVPILIFQGQINGLAKKKAALQAEESKLVADNAGLVQRMTLVFRRLNDFSQLLGEHRFNSNLFVFLGTICHRRAQFTGLAISDASNHLTIGLKTENFKTLGEQLLILKSNPQVSNSKFSGLAIDKDGKIVGMLDFDFDRKIITPLEGL